MECYSQEFATNHFGSIMPPKRPVQFKSLRAAKIAYAEFIMDCDNLGLGVPSPMWVWQGNKEEVDKHNGIWLYVDSAYVVFEIGPRGGIKTTYL